MLWRHVREGEVEIHSFLTLASNGDVWSTSQPDCFTPGGEPWYPLNRSWGEPQSQSGLYGQEKNSCSSTAKVEVHFQIQVMFMTFYIKGLFSFYCECDKPPTDKHEHKYAHKNVTLPNLRLKWPARRFSSGYDHICLTINNAITLNNAVQEMKTLTL